MAAKQEVLVCALESVRRQGEGLGRGCRADLGGFDALVLGRAGAWGLPASPSLPGVGAPTDMHGPARAGTGSQGLFQLYRLVTPPHSRFTFPADFSMVDFCLALFSGISQDQQLDSGALV